jgi:hypothetical protein
MLCNSGGSCRNTRGCAQPWQGVGICRPRLLRVASAGVGGPTNPLVFRQLGGSAQCRVVVFGWLA